PAAVVPGVDGDAGGHGGDVGGGAAGAVRVVLPGGLGHERRAARSAGAKHGALVPDPLGPAPLAAGAAPLGAADRGHRGEVGRVADLGEPGVAGGDHDGVARVVVGPGE